MGGAGKILLATVAFLCILSGCATSSNGPDPYLVKAFTAWGDSLTAGCEDGTPPYCSYPNQLGQLALDSLVNIEGIGGQTSAQIAARMGAVPTSVTDSFTIPSSGSVSGVTFKPGYEPCRNIGAPGNAEGTIDGVQVYCQDGGKGVYTLTRVAEGAALNVNEGDIWTPVLPADALSGMNIIWAGDNNASVCPKSGVTTDNCQVASDIAAMTSYVTAHGGRFLVLTVINGEADGYAPSTAYEEIAAVDSWITSTYPNNSLDIREALVAAYNPASPPDVIDHEHDIPPFSLRAFDTRGTLATPVSSTTTCAISFGVALTSGIVVTIGSEYIMINSGSDGAYTCVRGYGGSTAATYPNGTSWVGADMLHLSGAGTKNTNNPNGPGYTFVAKSIWQRLQAHP